MKTQKRIIISGASGTGKSGLISVFDTKGYQCFRDVARELIQDGFTPPVWDRDKNDSSFGEMVLRARIEQFEQAQAPGLVFYDRAMPDGLVFSKFLNRIPHAALIEAVRVHRYSTNVFILPPWKEIFVEDEARKESFDDIQKLHEFTLDIYTAEGYNCVIVPRNTIGERVKFILACLDNSE